jgi:predicted nucleotidyltransferase component of viral defense system
MISAKSFSKEWISQAAATLRVQEAILEKSIHALALVGRLAQEGLEFVFKGGTSLMLHLDPIRRLSIDVDIASLEPEDRVREILNRVADNRPFTRWEHQDWRDGENPPTKYFRLFYPSPFDPAQESSIQLDVLVTEAAHPVVETREIKVPFLEMEKPMAVQVPTVESLLGDKLTAFAPTTIGILYEPVHKKTGELVEPRPIRVMKQLFDVGELFAAAQNLQIVADSYATHFKHQNGYRGGKHSLADALEDTISAAYELSQIDLKPRDENERSAFFRRGVSALNSHLIDRRLNVHDAKTAAARAALLATLIKSGNVSQSIAEFHQIPSDPDTIKNLRIDGRWRKLHTLRKTNVEAFYLWHLAHKLDASGS